MNITSIFKQYNQRRQRQIAVNETAWQVYITMQNSILPQSISVAALQLRKRLRERGVEISHRDACKRMLKMEKGR